MIFRSNDWGENQYAFLSFLHEASKFVPRVKAGDVRGCWFLRCDKHDVSKAVTLESANSCEVISQRFTAAPFERLTEFFDCFADDLFGLLDFHDCSPVSGASCPLHQTARDKFPKQRAGGKKLVRPGWNGSHAGVTQALRGAKRASGDRRREAYTPWRGDLKATKIGERDKSSNDAEWSESGN